MRFDGRVAIVTGAGSNPGLGRSHALLLAARGARVVVNDLGVGPDGSGRDRSNAETVAEEIRAAGGEAIASTESVASEAGARRIVQQALDSWGRLDILVNNAGVGVVADFDEITPGDVERLIGVHLMGHVWMSRAAFVPMKAAGYGRIVNTTSGAMFGSDGLTTYAAAKFGIYGLTRGLAHEGEAHGIVANALSPGAATRSGDRFFRILDPEIEAAYNARFLPERVSAAIAYLAHEDCAVTGALLDAGGGHVSARIVCATPGITSDDVTPEMVRDNYEAIFGTGDLKVMTRPGTQTQMAGKSTQTFLERRPYEPIA